MEQKNFNGVIFIRYITINNLVQDEKDKNITTHVGNWSNAFNFQLTKKQVNSKLFFLTKYFENTKKIQHPLQILFKYHQTVNF